MVCKNCGAMLSNKAKFCTECGSPVSQEVESGKKKTSFIESKDFVIIFAAIVVTFFLIFNANKIENLIYGSKTMNEAINPISGNAYDCHVEYVGYQVIVDPKPRLMVYYRFTNNSEKDHTYNFDFCTTSEAYQDGARLNNYFGDSQEEEDRKTSIKPGGSIIVCQGYYLRNRKSPVEVTLKEFVPLFSTEIGTMTIPIA